MRYLAREKGDELIRELCITVDDFPQWINDLIDHRAGLFEDEGFTEKAAQWRALKYPREACKSIGSFSEYSPLPRRPERSQANG